MKRLLASIIILALVLLTAGCSAVPAQKETGPGGASGPEGTLKANGTGAGDNSADEVKYYPSFDSNYKTARNVRFDFWFDIPAEWKAVDKSADGEVFTIDPSNDNVSLLVYGATIEGGEEDFYGKLSGKDGSVEDFGFRDGWTGKKITNGTKLYYIRADGDTYIIFYIDCKDDTAWFSENRDTLEYIGRSLRISQESFGSIDGGNSISLDDLQLGNVKLDMPYEKVLDVMKSKPENEETDEYEGMEAKTLFYKDGTEIYLVDGAVYSINVISGDYPTPRGLKVGDTAERLKELYGEPNNKNDATHWGYTYDGYELFSVVLEDNKIVEIQVDLVM
jgi:uncharacterized protein YceK